jgi:hypothetical protein
MDLVLFAGTANPQSGLSACGLCVGASAPLL